MSTEDIILYAHESETYGEIESEVLFLDIAKSNGLLCLMLALLCAIITLILTHFILAVIVFIVVLMALLRKCQSLCKINPYWLEYMSKQNYGNKTWIGG